MFSQGRLTTHNFRIIVHILSWCICNDFSGFNFQRFQTFYRTLVHGAFRSQYRFFSKVLLSINTVDIVDVAIHKASANGNFYIEILENQKKFFYTAFPSQLRRIMTDKICKRYLFRSLTGGILWS